MSLDEQFRQVLERAAHDLSRVAAEERTRAVARATETAVADTRTRADAELAQIQDAAQAHIDELHRTTETRVIELTRALDAARDDARREVAETRRLAQTQTEMARAEFELRLAELRARVADLESQPVIAQQGASDAHRAGLAVGLDRLRVAFQQMDAACTLAEVLNAVAKGAEAEVTRAAVFLVRGTRLQGWSLHGYGPVIPPARAFDLELTSAGVAGDAVARTSPILQSRGERAPIDAGRRPIPDESTPSVVAALPLLVGGVPAALLYVEVDETSAPAITWHPALDLLTRHAAKVLELLTLRQVTGLGAAASMARRSHTAVAGMNYDEGPL